MVGDYDRTKVWPTSSLKRLQACMDRFEAKRAAAKVKGVEGAKAVEAVRAAHEGRQGGNSGSSGSSVQVDSENVRDLKEEEAEEGDKTPTVGSPGEDDFDEEEFEKRAEEIERALTERLEQLTLKLKEQDPQTEVEEKAGKKEPMPGEVGGVDQVKAHVDVQVLEKAKQGGAA
jgi:hypothetical protein